MHNVHTSTISYILDIQHYSAAVKPLLMSIKLIADLYELVISGRTSLVVLKVSNSLQKKQNNESIALSETRYKNCHNNKNIMIIRTQGDTVTDVLDV